MNYLIQQRVIPAFVVILILIVSCKDYNGLNLEEIDSGSVDFTTYVAVGNSLTAGFQNGALYRDGQEFSFPKLIARQIRFDESFNQPLIPNPGIGFEDINGDGEPEAVGRLELTDISTGLVVRDTNPPLPINPVGKPFKNLGIPGSILIDYLNPNNQGQLKQRSTQPDFPGFNPFYSYVLPNSELAKDAPNIHNQVIAQNPTFITFWMGNNDVLGYVTSGGEGQSITDAAAFDNLYKSSVQALQSTGAGVVAFNIPDITKIPFVFLLRSQLEQQGAIIFDSESQSYKFVTPDGNFDMYVRVEGNSEIMRAGDLLLLSATGYFAKVQAGETPPPIKPANAIPDPLVLDGPRGGAPGSSEVEKAVQAVARFNNSIDEAIANSDFALVDVNAIFSDIFDDFISSGGTGGYQVNSDLTLQPVPGSLFSFDGIHVTNQGAGVIANETIKVINSSFGANVEEVQISVIPKGIPVN